MQMPSQARTPYERATPPHPPKWAVDKRQNRDGTTSPFRRPHFSFVVGICDADLLATCSSRAGETISSAMLRAAGKALYGTSVLG